MRVRIHLRADGGTPTGEWVWAVPVEADHAGGRYELQHHAFLAALAAGDQVWAVRNRDGDLQVVDVVRPAPAVLTLVGRVWDAVLELDVVLDRWAAAGARLTEGAAGALATVWADGMSPEAVLEVMRPELEAGVLELLEVSRPEDRVREALEGEVDFGGVSG